MTVGAAVAATGKLAATVGGAVITVVSVVVGGAAKGDVKTVVAVARVVAVKGDVKVVDSVVVKLADNAPVIGVATGDNGDS